MVSLPFTPLAIVGVILVFYFCFPVCFNEDEEATYHWWQGPLALLLYIPGVVIGTPIYMIIVLVSGCVKVVKPELASTPEDDSEDKSYFCCIDGDIIFNMVAKWTPMLRMGEVATESYPQSVLGES